MLKNKTILFLFVPFFFCSFISPPLMENSENWNTLSIYLRLDGINGESQEANHLDWIEVSSYSFAAQNSRIISNGQSQLGKGRAETLAITAKIADKSLTSLINKCLKSEHIGSNIFNANAELHIARANGSSMENLEESKFKLVYVTNVTIQGFDPVNGTVIVNFNLDYGAIERKIIEYDNGGTPSFQTMQWSYIKNNDSFDIN